MQGLTPVRIAGKADELKLTNCERAGQQQHLSRRSTASQIAVRLGGVSKGVMMAGVDLELSCLGPIKKLA